MGSRRGFAVILIAILCFQGSFAGIRANAAEPGNGTEKAEYIVQVKDEKAFKEVVADNRQDVVEAPGAEELEEQQVAVLELTEKEAEKLQREKDVLWVEENIVLEASSATDADITEQITETEEGITESLTEQTGEITTQVTTETVTEKETQGSPVTEGETSKKEKKEKKKKKTEKETKKKEESTAEEMKRRKLEKKKAMGEDVSGLQWNLSAIHLPEEDMGKGQIKIAVLDSGVSFDEDIPIVERIAISEGEMTDNVLFDDTTGHGTGLAGIIGAQNNGSGIRGINPDAQIYSIQILDENNQTTLSNLVAAIYKAQELDCQIINMSLGTSVNSRVLYEAVHSAYDAGILMVAAAGNAKGKAVEYPAAYEEVLAVGSTDTTGNKVESSCDGKEIEIFAPGSQIPTSGLFGGVSVVEGTSIAAAQVTGAASLIWSMDTDKSAGFVRSLLINTAQEVEEKGSSQAGLLDISNAAAHFEELEGIYTEKQTEYRKIQDDNGASEEYTGVELVNGSWNKSTHAGMVSEAASGYNIQSKYIKLMQEAARLADHDDYKAAGYLHGGNNYVRGLKFLYQCAGYLRSGMRRNAAIEKASSDAKMDNTPKNVILRDKTRLLLESDILSSCEEESPGAMYYKVMGFAMHLVGDVYAHRTIVPQYTVKGTNPSAYKKSTSAISADAMFGSGDFKAQGSHSIEADGTLKEWAKQSSEHKKDICKRWKCFEKTINMGYMEFRDVKNYTTVSSTGKYEDNPDFCKERYVDAKFMCEVLFETSYSKDSFDGIYILSPTEKNVKLNYLRGYANNMGEDISIFTTEEWKKISTMEEY
ncbi:MAG: S8 family serine peptidase [Lachnospiraceae bacterium]|nr:S8 family serine peptidase [Lachnospiraceae bacterium]